MKTSSQYKELDRIKKELDKCVRCGFCASYCPVYRVEREESTLARGKNRILKGLVEGKLEFSEDTAKILDKCTLCMTCTQNCPTNSPIPSLIVAARADRVSSKGIRFPMNMVYQSLLPQRRLFGNVVRIASWVQKVWFPKTKGNIRHLPLFLSGLGKNRNIPEIAPNFLRQMIPEINDPPLGTETRITVGYFMGCMTDYVFPAMGKKIIEFLTKNGVKVVVPGQQGCCGAPVFLGAGDFDTGRKMADCNVEAFKGLDYIITDCATCASAMREYGKYLADDEDRMQKYARFAEKNKDITEFLIDVLKLPPSAYVVADEFKGKRVTWHEPCHLGRYLGIKEQPRKLLKSLSDIEYVEMPNADRCCGMSGAFGIYYYDISKKIADDKALDIASTNADVVVTDCPGCQIQLTDTMLRHNMPQQVRHIMELCDTRALAEPDKDALNRQVVPLAECRT